MADSVTPLTASFASPWPIVPDYPPPTPFANPLLIKYLCSPLAFHAAAAAAAATTPPSIGKEPVYPWSMVGRPVQEPVKRNAAGLPQYHQAQIGCYNVLPSTESVTPGPLSPQPTPPTSLSPGNYIGLLFSHRDLRARFECSPFRRFGAHLLAF